MYASVWGCALDGLSAQLVKVEVDVGRGLPAFEVVGLPNRTVKESRDRIRSAFRNTGFQFPPTRVTVNLAPADFPKTSSTLDLPIAVAILLATDQINWTDLGDCLFWGELSLDGQIQSCRGIINAALLAGKEGMSLIYPKSDRPAVESVSGLSAQGFADLSELVSVFNQGKPKWRISKGLRKVGVFQIPDPWQQLKISGGLLAKRFLTVAAAGRHNLALVGPPGVGKTMLVQALKELLPPLRQAEILEVARIYSAVGLEVKAVLKGEPPFRAPHHTVTLTGLLGGGLPPKPGEMTLAHKGLLFLDELPEFSRKALAVLREPLESKVIRLSRGNKCYYFPSDFQLACAFNPCPCGFHRFQPEKCRCTYREINAYLRPVIGPLADRIHLRLAVARPLWEEQASSRREAFPVSIEAARAEVENRDQARLESRLVQEGRHFLRLLFKEEQLSARAYYQLLSVASTISALEGSELISGEHLGEAWQYRWQAAEYLEGAVEDAALS
ncbi:MAG: YifB family Mg chelatase-like AAA ATPase [Firmicutes bacterium]|nr:YifB family Mg chelatase-like AAA ATPase [Bacillota bacterium]